MQGKALFFSNKPISTETAFQITAADDPEQVAMSENCKDVRPSAS